MWPEPVERIAAFLRVSGVEGRLEELLPGAGPPAGQKLRVDGFDGDGAAVGRYRKVAPGPATDFPFEGARVFMDQSVLSADGVWLEAGSPRHVLELSAVQIARVTSAETADLLREG